MHDQIKKAFELSNKAHIGHMYDHNNYSKHLEDVYKILLWAGFKEDNKLGLNILISGIRHDDLEDTNTSHSDLTKDHNHEVADIVWACTDDNRGKNRKDKKILTYPKIRANQDAIIVKLADRIANCENSIGQGKDSKFLKMYKEEHRDFKWALYVPWQEDSIKLWRRLDNLMG